ncbi:MAG: DUF6049 family protein [Gordonia sp. (in: high G+C Gram-positive bacteria)]
MRDHLRALIALLGALTLATVLAAPAAGAPADDDQGQRPQRFATVSVESLTPTLVTTTSSDNLTISGHIRNTSSRVLREVMVRLERGDAVTGAAQLRTSLTVAHPPIEVASPFRSIAGELLPGSSVAFTLTMSLSGVRGLQLSHTGVYPLQVNVNAVPDYGSTAQVASSRTLLPVLSLPPNTARAAEYAVSAADNPQLTPDTGTSSNTGQSWNTGLGADGSISADTSAPTRLTFLWPLAAPPQLAPGGLGGGTDPARLISEDMSRSLRSGRLRTLLDAVRNAVTDTAVTDTAEASTAPTSTAETNTAGAPTSSGTNTPDSAAPHNASAGAATISQGPDIAPAAADLARSLCLAIDPDLLVTVQAMSLGYVVSTDPTDPASPTVPGNGQDAAQAWLSELRGLAKQICVTALPFSQADLSALAAIKSSGLVAASLDSPADIVDTLLGVHSVRGLVVAPMGALDAAGAAVLRDSGHSRVLVAATTVAPTGAPAATGSYRVGPVTAQTFDVPVSTALGALGTNPVVPALTPPGQQLDLGVESALSRRQSALAALAYAAIDTPTGAASGQPRPLANTSGRGQVLMPPTYWSPTTDDAEALFSTVTVLLGAKAAQATPLPTLIRSLATSTATGRLIVPAGIGPVTGIGPRLTPALADQLRSDADQALRMQAALVESADAKANPERYLAPLREDMLRAIRFPEQHRPAQRTRLDAERTRRIRAVEATMHRLGTAVTILDPGGRYTLASERSPLLLVVRNDLALPIRVRIATAAPKDLDIGDIGVVEIPARGTRQIQLPTRAYSSEATTVHISMLTVTGLNLGSPISLSVYSNAYGKPLFIITIIAGIALVLLTARRLWRRFRGKPDPADADRPEPDEDERVAAASTYQQRRRTLRHEGPPVIQHTVGTQDTTSTEQTEIIGTDRTGA